MRARLALLAALAVVPAVLAGCGSAHPEATPLIADAASTAVDCTAEWEVGRGSIPADFEPVAGYVCDPLLALGAPTGDDGEPVGGLPSTDPQLLVGDLAPLVAAFGELSDPRWPGPCTAIGVIVVDVWLVNASGDAVRPAYPVDGCGIPKDGVGAALAVLTPAR